MLSARNDVLYAFGFQLFNQYCIKQLFYQTGRSTCTRSSTSRLYLSLFHKRSAGVRIPIFPSTAWTGSPFLDLLSCPQLTDSLIQTVVHKYNTGEYRIPVLPGTDLCSDFFPSSSCMRSSRRWDISGPFSFLQECLPLSMPKVR